ncbi:MAG: hypothetical protein J6Y94_00520, partial [Bacteriovoracaceae bacterium]|nr:hypothetical protein [Bacteriovoracaceae bacterium]
LKQTRSPRSSTASAEDLAKQIEELEKSDKISGKDLAMLKFIQQEISKSEASRKSPAPKKAAPPPPDPPKAATAGKTTTHDPWGGRSPILILGTLLEKILTWAVILSLAAVGFQAGAMRLPAMPRTSPGTVLKLGMGIFLTFIGRLIIWMGIFTVAFMFLCPAGFKNIAALISLYFIYRAFWGGHQVFVAFCLTGDFRVIFSVRRCAEALNDINVGRPVMVFICYILGWLGILALSVAIILVIAIPVAALLIFMPARAGVALSALLANGLHFGLWGAMGLYFGQIFQRWQPSFSPLAYHPAAPVKKLPVQPSNELNAKLNRYKIS